MIREYTREALEEIDRSIKRIQEEAQQAAAEEWAWHELLTTTLPDLQVDRMENPYESVYESAGILEMQIDRTLREVYAVEERYATRFHEIRKCLELYLARVRNVAEMIHPEKLFLDKEAYRSGFASAQYAYEEQRARIRLLDGYLTAEQIENLSGYGYDHTALLALCKDMNEEELRFFTCLADGTEESYRIAFQINPMQLSEQMDMIMADYAVRLFGDGTDLSQLERFCNAMLAAPHLAGTTGQVVSTDLSYRMMYLQKICDGTQFYLGGVTAMMANIQPESKLYQALGCAHEAYMAMMGFWSTNLGLVGEETIQASISDLIYTQGEQLLLFQFIHNEPISVKPWDSIMDPIIGNVRDTTAGDQIMIRFYQAGDEMSIELGSNRFRRSQSVLTDITNAAIENTIKDIMISVLGITGKRELQVMASAYTILTGGDSGLQGMEGLFDNKTASTVAEGSESIINVGLNILQRRADYQNALASLEEVKQDEIARLFYSGGSCLVNGRDAFVSFYGLYDQEILRALRVTEEQGLRVWLGWDRDRVDDLENLLSYSGLADDIKKVADALVYGNFSFQTFSYTENGNEVEVSYDEFIEALQGLGVEATWLSGGTDE